MASSGRSLGPFGRLALYVLGHKRGVALAVLLITVVSAVIGLPPKVDTDLLSLLPKDDPVVASLVKLHEEEGGANLVTIALNGEEEQLYTSVAQLEAAFSALPEVRYVLGELDPDLARRIGLLQVDLEPAEIRELSRRLQGALAMGPALNPIMLGPLMAMGPVTDKLALASEPPSLFGVRGNTARVLIRPTGSSHDQEFAFALMADVERILDETLPGTGVEVTWIGGAYRHNVEDVAGVKRDVAVTSGASAAMVLLVILIVFRSFKALPIVFIPLIVANVVNFAIIRVAIGHLNTYTSFGSAVLIGLGIDFAVHLVARYREERARGLDVDDAITMAWDRTGPACATAALTSAAGFVALGVAEFRGFSQLGLVLGTGLIISLLAMLVCLPLLLSWLDKEAPPMLGQSPKRARKSASTYSFAPIGLMAFVLVTALVGTLRLPETAFEYDISATRGDGLAYAELTAEEQALAADSYAPVIVSYDDRTALRRAETRVRGLIADGSMPHVSRAISIEDVLPTDRSAQRAALAQLASQLESPNLRYLPPPLVQRLLPLRGYDGEALRREDIPEGLLSLFGSAEAGTHRMLLFPTGNMWDMREADALSDEIAMATPNREATGEQLVFASLYRLVKRDMPLIGLLAFLLVCALTAIDLRKVPRILGAIGALIAGMIWAGAATQAVGIRLSMLNVVGIPILLGIGVDVIIHLIHRLAEEGPGGVRRALRTTGVAALVSALTTMLSFSSLWLASNRGVRSLGSLVFIGLGVIVMATAVVLPLAWAAGWRIKKQSPAQDRTLPPGAPRG
ncbi:MAG: putative RND superfamily exporter protein [Myxococcota bacterium]